MYTSGTTSEPKGVLISNETVVTVVSGIKFSLTSINEEVSSESSVLLMNHDNVYFIYFHISDIFPPFSLENFTAYAR